MVKNEEKNCLLSLSLDGDWDFTYTPQIGEDGEPLIPKIEEFTVKMPVPGYWDDNINRMQSSGFWGTTVEFNPNFRHIDFPMGDNMPPDASLPYIKGVGWYRKTISIPLVFNEEKEVVLTIGGVILEAWVWLNGELVKYHLGHSTPFEISLGRAFKYGKKNEIIIAVANTRNDRLGCVIRGFKGFSAGIYRSVNLKVTEGARIKECYIYPTAYNQELKWLIELDGILLGREHALLNWYIKDPENNSIISKGSIPATEKSLEWTTGTFGMQPWSDKSPKLYEIDLELIYADNIIDVHTQTFGLRLLERNGTSLRLNGCPVFLRGTTEHAYFPLTCTPPKDLETYISNIRKLKALGFNWLRFHTWVPSEEYMQAADQLGMMIQVEAPLGFGKQEWLDILYTCRRHPSVVIYCCGNEELLDEKKIEELRVMANLCHRIAPDALFNPQEAMRGIEYYLNKSGVEEKNIEEPFPHNPERLESIREFSDVFGQYPLGLLSYISTRGDWRLLNQRLEIFKRPCLSHEISIHGNYLNLDLEHRYEGTRIGTEMFASVRRYLKKEGLLSRAALYYKNSCAWMKILRKHNVEMARKCKYNAGYDFLGAIDHHWHRCGYPCGIMNEFYELKPGETSDDVLKYNGESLILLDHTNNRNLKAGDTLSLDLYSSLYGKSELEDGNISWYLADDKHHIHQRDGAKVKNICNGAVEKLMVISITAPKTDVASKLTLYVHLSGGEYEISNQWDFWVFPEFKKLSVDVNPDTFIADKFKNIFGNIYSTDNINNKCIKIISNLDKDSTSFIAAGGIAILLGNKPFPALPTSFQLAIAGRVQGNLATVIEDHPLMNSFPHEGFCDWQFYNMIEDGSAVLFNEINIPFKPIIEVVSTFKLIRKQSNLFEIGIGQGKLLVCTLNLNEQDPAAVYLLGTMINYVNSSEFKPGSIISMDVIMRLIDEDINMKYEFATDEALDPNVSKKR